MFSRREIIIELICDYCNETIKAGSDMVCSGPEGTHYIEGEDRRYVFTQYLPPYERAMKKMKIGDRIDIWGTGEYKVTKGGK